MWVSRNVLCFLVINKTNWIETKLLRTTFDWNLSQGVKRLNWRRPSRRQDLSVPGFRWCISFGSLLKNFSLWLHHRIVKIIARMLSLECGKNIPRRRLLQISRLAKFSPIGCAIAGMTCRGTGSEDWATPCLQCDRIRSDKIGFAADNTLTGETSNYSDDVILRSNNIF